MQLLHASSVPVSQFASLSLLLSDGTPESITVVAPHATCSIEAAATLVREVHSHVRRIISKSESKSLASQLMREEEPSLQQSIQIYRPVAGNGISLHVRFLQGSDGAKLQPLILAVNKSAPGKADPSSGVIGVLLCVAVAGVGPTQWASSLLHALPQRMDDCIGHLGRLGDLASAKRLLTAFLLTEDDYRITNDRMEAPNILLLPESDDRGRGILSPLGMISPIAEFGRTARRASTGIVRGVISAGIGGGGGALHNNQDSAPPVDVGFALRLDLGAAEAARILSEKLTVLSVAESGTILRKYAATGRDRMANLDLTIGAKSRFRRKKSDTRAADFDHFDYKGPSKTVVQRENKAVSTLQPLPEPTSGKLQLKSSSKDTKRGGQGTRRTSTAMGYRDEDSSQQLVKKNGIDPFSTKIKSKPQFDDETHDSRSHSGNHDAISVMSQERVHINIALNEDLTCSYKLSQLSSCNVEGVVQAQIKATSRPVNIPFSLLVRDISSQLDTLQENKKFAEKVTAIPNRQRNGGADYRFKIALPKQETYYPILKYKCTGDLRPVPIRVQTKVKVDASYCRVALQISSNPNNDATLSDLTIVMGVPNLVRGETLATQPAGGQWDESKSTVVWCVSELGSGEKFQLQAKFELEKGARATNDLNFPVLVRCQCLHIQLSDVEFDVKDSSNDFPAELMMKVARRYRLSHREKNG